MGSLSIAKHGFTETILEILEKHFPGSGEDILSTSHLINYLNIKTKSANSGSKARGAFANHYAIYVLIKDYIDKGFADPSRGLRYADYEGARFTDLMKAQRALPFGSKLQNHALNGRMNDEFNKYFHTLNKRPIVRNVETQRYWVQEDLLKIEILSQGKASQVINVSRAIIDIIDAYVSTKKEAFEAFLEACKQIAELTEKNPTEAIDFVNSQLQPNVDARVFEIVSYAILKVKYAMDSIWIGRTKLEVAEEMLLLYKTGRTNANDGGIDFVMKPVGRFFQVTETLDVNKYFLDIDKVQRFPITFVIKTDVDIDEISRMIRRQAISKYNINSIVELYMASIEEIINIPILVSDFQQVLDKGKLADIMNEIVNQSKIEFNYEAISEVETLQDIAMEADE